MFIQNLFVSNNLMLATENTAHDIQYIIIQTLPKLVWQLLLVNDAAP